MRPIDADALIDELQKDEAKFNKEAEDAQNDPSYTECYSDAMWSRANGIRDAIIEVYDAPTIDAVEVVRCKECRWATETRMKSIEGDVIYLKTCPSRTEVIDDDDFCSYGERKGE